MAVNNPTQLDEMAENVLNELQYLSSPRVHSVDWLSTGNGDITIVGTYENRPVEVIVRFPG